MSTVAALAQLLKLWKGNATDFLGRGVGDVDASRFLGLDIELGPEHVTWMIHQQSYIYAFLREMYSYCLKERRTPGEPETLPAKPVHVEARKAKKKHPPLQEGQDPLDHAPILRLVGVLLWISLQTRPDISWAVPRITRLATTDERRRNNPKFSCIKFSKSETAWPESRHILTSGSLMSQRYPAPKLYF